MNRLLSLACASLALGATGCGGGLSSLSSEEKAAILRELDVGVPKEMQGQTKLLAADSDWFEDGKGVKFKVVLVTYRAAGDPETMHMLFKFVNDKIVDRRARPPGDWREDVRKTKW